MELLVIVLTLVLVGTGHIRPAVAEGASQQSEAAGPSTASQRLAA
jgi:hypothetical protein